MSIEAMKQAYAVPLIEQLESVPTDARMMYEHDKFHHQNIPVGRLCHEAATALRQAIEQAEKLKPTLWLGIGGDGRVKYTTDSDRALKWKQAGSYRLVRDYYTSPVHASDISQERVDETVKDRHEPIKLRRGNLLRCIETDELCTVWATSTSGKTLVHWGCNDFTEYTAEQIGELFWLEPESNDVEVAAEQSDNYAAFLAGVRFARVNLPAPSKEWVGLTDKEVTSIIREWHWMPYELCKVIEAKLKEKNT
jgi:hypothetical protein